MNFKMIISSKLRIDTGSNTDQENLSKSKAAILGNTALDHIMTKIIKNDFNTNGQTHYEYILEKLNIAQWDLTVMISIAKNVKESLKGETDNN